MSEYSNVTPYADRKGVAKSYRPKSGQMSPGLMRAREPYRVRNLITGLAIGAFGVGIWAWSIGAVKQDEFTDVDEEARVLAASARGRNPTTATIGKDGEVKK
jgi:cytochrome c oxidase assembly factor 3